MKKLFLTLALCTLIITTGCAKKQPDIPKSIMTYQQLNLTAEQNQQLKAIRDKQIREMDVIRKDLEKQRTTLLENDKKNLTEEQKRENLEKYKTEAEEMRNKVAKSRADYDEAFKGILDDQQKKVFDKYLKQREKEKQQFEKKLAKKAK